MLKYDNGLELDVTIGGVQLPDNEFAFHRLSLVSDCKFFVPMMTLAFADPKDVLRKAGVTLYDAIPIVISLGGNGAEKRNYEFRMFRYQQQHGGNVQQYKLNGYLDAPLYLGGSDTKGYKGTTSEVISQVASKCGLLAEVDSTTDSQQWWQANKRNSEFVRYLAQHGFKTEDSHMSVGLRLDKTLRYLDVNAIEDSNDVWLSYTKNASNVARLVDHAFSDPMGGNNFIRGYRSRMVDQKVDTPDTNYNDSTLNPRATTVGMNLDIQSQIDRGKVEFSPLYSPEQVHENWAKARHQNLRSQYLNNTTCKAFTPNQTGLDLFDSVKLDSSLAAKDNTDSDGAEDSRAGQYIVSGKSIILVGKNYGESLSLVRGGLNGASSGSK